MAKWVKNVDTINHTYAGQLILPSEYYLIQVSENASFISDVNLIADISSSLAKMAYDNSGTQDIDNISEGLDLLKDISPTLKDSDGANFSRLKQATQGYTYQARGIQLETSVLNSVINNDKDGNSYGDTTIKFYDSFGVEITDQPTLDSSCVETRMDFEPIYDYDLIGGGIFTLVAPASSLLLYCIGVPDIPAGSGGSKIMISGINLQYMPAKTEFIIDGRTPKHMVYDATYHTNKVRKIFKHTAGLKCKMLVVWEHYKS